VPIATRTRGRRSLLRRQEGITLVLAVGILGVLSFGGTTLVYYSSTNMRSAEYSNRNSSAYVLAEAGINEMMAVLSHPDNNALNKHLLGYRPDGAVTATVSSYDGGTVEWWGTLDEASAVWSLTSVGKVKSASAASVSEVTRTVTAKVPVTPTLTQPLNSPAWNYIFATRTGNTCDMTISQSVQVGSPLYVHGNLCLQNTAAVRAGPLVVRGKLTLAQSANAVGSLLAPINEAHIGAGCIWKNNLLHLLCSPLDNVYATLVDASPPTVAAPAVDWDGWYRNASPGPYFSCLAPSGPVPVFDNDQGSPASPDPSRRNFSVFTPFNLTPAMSYTCQTAGGELSWNAGARVLTVRGTIFIDGSARIENGAVNTYQGQGTLYLSGTFLVKNSKLCARLAAGGTGCDSAGWDPNSAILVVVANGPGGDQVPTGDSIQLVSATFQGALYGTHAVEIDTTSQAIGPIIGSTVYLGQSTATSFPTLTVAPVGMPGNPVVHAQPNPPELYGG
jgi:hypothetical protein